MGTKVIFPSNISAVVIDGHEYTPDENGVVESVTGNHVASLLLIGGENHNPDNQLRPLAPEEKASVLLDENAILRARIRDLEAAASAPGVATGRDGEPLGATDTGAGVAPAGGTAPGALGDPAGQQGGVQGRTATTTALPQGQSGDGLDKDADKIKALIQQAPNTDDPNVTRDQLVAFLNSINVAVPGNISRDKAAEIVKDKVNGLNEEADKLASEARSAAQGTATDAKN